MIAQTRIVRTAPGQLRLPVLRWPFRYQGDASGRDWRLDFLRGWCLFSMVVDHAAGDHQTFLLKVTGNGGYPMTGAHGFVFLSGMVFSVVYGKIVAQDGWSKALPKALRRALTLYLVAVILGLLGALFSLTPWGGAVPLNDALNIRTIFNTLILHGANDSLMTLYLLLVLAGPLALYAMQKRKTWLLMSGSLFLWFGHLVMPNHFGNPLDIFVPAAEWQVYFVAGLVLGHHREALGRWLQGARRQAYLVILFTLFACLVILQLATAVGSTVLPVPTSSLEWLASQVYTDYDHNPPIHVLAILVAFLGLYHLIDWFWAPLKALFGWFLIPIGGAALYLYILHTVVVYYVLLPIEGFRNLDGVLLGFTLLGLMLGFWLMVRFRLLYQVVPR